MYHVSHATLYCIGYHVPPRYKGAQAASDRLGIMAESPLSDQQAWQPYKSHPLRQVVGANGLNPIQATEPIKRTGDGYK